MGLTIQIENVLFTKNLGSLIPFAENLKGYWLFNSDLASAITNKVTGVAGTVIGSPVVVDKKITVDKAKGFVTDVTLLGDKTFIAIAKTTTGAIFLGTVDYTAAGTTGEGIGVIVSKYYTLIDESTQATSLEPFDSTKIKFVAGAFGSVNNSIFVSNSGALAEASKATVGSLDDTDFLKIGGWGAAASVAGTADIYAAMAYNRKLSGAELKQVLDYLASKLSGITIS